MYADHTHTIVELRDISFAYRPGAYVLRNVNLNIHEGDYLGIIGPNGGGKTTLLHIILGLIKPEKGTVLLFGKPVHQFLNWHKIGYVSQRATHFDMNFPVTVWDVVCMGRYASKGILHRLSSEDFALVQDALRKTGIEDLRDRRLGTLSGGQQQRVFIARALAGQPDIIFLDEPTVGVDAATQEQFYELLHTLNADLHKTLVLVSHDIEVVSREVTEIACVNTTVLYDSHPKDFLKQGGLERLYGDSVKLLLHNH